MMEKIMGSLPATWKGRLETALAEIEGAAKGFARKVLAPLNAAVAPKEDGKEAT
jgi:hypothetical protein